MNYLFVILLIILSTVFTILTFATYKEQQVIFGLFAFICWFISAGFVIFVEFPYTIVYENSANVGTHVIVSGMHGVTDMAVLRWLFLGLGFISLGYSLVMFLWNFFRTMTPGGEEEEEEE